jgi:hypothetical protein
MPLPPLDSDGNLPLNWMTPEDAPIRGLGNLGSRVSRVTSEVMREARMTNYLTTVRTELLQSMIRRRIEYELLDILLYIPIAEINRIREMMDAMISRHTNLLGTMYRRETRAGRGKEETERLARRYNRSRSRRLLGGRIPYPARFGPAPILGSPLSAAGQNILRFPIEVPPTPRLRVLLRPLQAAGGATRVLGPSFSFNPAGLLIFVAVSYAIEAANKILPRLFAPPPRRPVRPPAVALGGDFADFAANLLSRVPEMAAAGLTIPPHPELTVNQQAFGQALNRYWQVVGGDLGQLLRQQTGRVVERVINLTPPFSSSRLERMLKAEKGTFGKLQARSVGERAVERDIRRVFIPVDELKDWQKSAKFRKAQAANDTETIARLLKGKFHFERVTVDVDTQHHQRSRSNDGRVRRKPHQHLVLNAESITKYVKRRQAQVGYAKSGWREAHRKFGAGGTLGAKLDPLPSWIKRHQGAGFVEDQTRNLTANEMYTRIGNSVSFIQKKGRELRIMEEAIKTQANALNRNVERILKNHAK